MLYSYIAKYKEESADGHKNDVYCTIALRNFKPSSVSGYATARNLCKSFAADMRDYMDENKPDGYTVDTVKDVGYSVTDCEDASYSTKYVIMTIEYVGSLGFPKHTTISGEYGSGGIDSWYETTLLNYYGYDIDLESFRLRSMIVNIY